MRTPLCLLMVTTLAACSSDFDPYNLLAEPRILAVRAEPPSVAPGGTTTLDALVHLPEPAAVEYAWSWCPLRAGTADAWECVISEEEIAALGITALPYDLGSGPTAELSLPLSPEGVAALCLDGGGYLPPYVTIPDCSAGLPVSVGLTIRAGGVEIRAFKEVRFLLDDATAANRNPAVTGLSWAPEDGALETATPVDENDRPLLVEGETYELFAAVPEEGAELFVRPFSADRPDPVTVHETLSLTWFIEAGTTRYTRTSYVDGAVGFDVLGHNRWIMPVRGELEVPESTVYLVLRDERGGVSWLSRTFALTAR